MIGEIMHAVIPGDDDDKPVWLLRACPNTIIALEDHYFNGTGYKVGEQWSYTHTRPNPVPEGTALEPPDHVIATAMRLTLERKILCVD